nr:uncharacterized protein LOC110374000 [Helicoverpa armigera]
MPDVEARMETMLFNYQTTYKTDYRRGEIIPHVPTVYKEKPTCLRMRPPPLKDVHTLTAWRKNAIPFSLMHHPKPIIRTDPNKVPESFVAPIDTEKEKVIRTRPRVVMSPAVALDDLDPETRNILCESMYTSNTTRASREAIANYFTVKAPMPSLPAPANPITLPSLEFPYVSPEWRMETVQWDRKQLRGYCDPTKEFWLAEKLPPCRACEETEMVRADRDMRYKMKTGRF